MKYLIRQKKFDRYRKEYVQYIKEEEAAKRQMEQNSIFNMTAVPDLTGCSTEESMLLMSTFQREYRRKLDEMALANHIDSSGISFIERRANTILADHTRTPISFEQWLSKKLNLTIKSEDIIIKL